MKPSERQLWRVLNASAITYLNLQFLVGADAEALGVVALDGIPINENGLSTNRAIWQSHLGIPPGGRMEFIVKAPPEGVIGRLITRSANTGTGGENDPERPLATIVASRHGSGTSFETYIFSRAASTSRIRVARQRKAGSHTKIIFLRDAAGSQRSE